MRVRSSLIGLHSDPLEALRTKELCEDILEDIDATAEMIESLLRCPLAAVGSPPFEHPALDPLFCLGGRQVGQGQEVFGFEMGAFLHKLLAALVIDDARYRVWERPVFRVSRRPRADCVALNHPAASQTQDRIQARAQGVHLGSSSGHHVGPSIGPTSRQRAILLQQNAVLYEGERKQKIGKTAWFPPVFYSLHSP